MPHSLILNILPQSPIPPQYLTGRHLHALFLTLVSSVDSQLGEYLHDAKADKPFTLSPLQSIMGQGDTLQWEHIQPIAAGTPCWWRISLLDDTLFSKLTHLWLNLNPHHPWHLGPADLQITSILGTPQSTQPWANAMSYTQLYEESSDSDRQIHFSFCTPTAFRQSNYDCALPTRELVFNSLIKRWNRYSGLELPKSILEPIFPSFFDIRTEIVTDSRSTFIGCIGAMNFRLLGKVDPLSIKQINALANFALYSGVGRKTPMGMGMVRRIRGC
ncbi:CRISPR-associated endoribonuclease Cas6 [Coleofasciculus sp. G2-EDA-02]|uniref:CRISPR-associated endoribonuclease Cas6 n=1 Tax=Coleofasciculus sp. G2-EDA-02 TaxID=3069529 RepID=UPI0033035055